MPRTETSDPCRRRGRPHGKNRVPLSLEERRARNALYERERRNETSDAMTQLAEAAGFDISMSNGDLLASVVARLQRAARQDPSEDLESLRRCNDDLMKQIADLEQRLGWSEVQDVIGNRNEYRHSAKAETFKERNLLKSAVKRREFHSDEEVKTAKRRKLEIQMYSNSDSSKST